MESVRGNKLPDSAAMLLTILRRRLLGEFATTGMRGLYRCADRTANDINYYRNFGLSYSTVLKGYCQQKDFESALTPETKKVFKSLWVSLAGRVL